MKAKKQSGLIRRKLLREASDKAWESVILPYRQAAAKRRGYVAEVTRRMNGRPHNVPIMQQHVFQWLGPAGRQPRLGIGLILLKALKEVGTE